MSENKSIADEGESIVLEDFKMRRKPAKRAAHGQGYDIKAGKLLIEVKSTKQTSERKRFFFLSKNEFECACKNKNFWLYWVDVKAGKIFKKISRDEILKYTKPHLQYQLQLTGIKKSGP